MTRGVLTSEFWIAVSVKLIGLLVLIGVVPQQDYATIAGAVTGGVTAIMTLLVTASAAVTYIRSRHSLKEQQAKLDADSLLMLRIQNAQQPPAVGTLPGNYPAK